jgi:DNA-binding NtrC family response regulator
MVNLTVDAVDHTSYIAKSRASLEALKSANLLKSLNISALVLGNIGTGKFTLAKFILPNAPVADGNDLQEVISLVSSADAIIIKNFDKINNYQKLQAALDTHKTRIIATSRTELTEKVNDRFFSLQVTLAPLSQRQEDIEPLINKFFKEISTVLGRESTDDIFLKDFSYDLSKNCYSLRKSVYLKYLVSTLDEEGVMHVMEDFLDEKIGGKNDYRDNLHLFDVPLIRSGYKKFNSQLSMSEKFGLNRNTLRKKINDYKTKYNLNPLNN